eukprot:g4248.t1
MASSDSTMSSASSSSAVGAMRVEKIAKILENPTKLLSDLASIQQSLEEAAALIYTEVQCLPVMKASVAFGETGSMKGRPVLTTTMNKSGDIQLPLDIKADKIVEKCLASNPLVAGIASEERDGFTSLNEKTGKYIVAFDPLDGSQNVPVGLNVGSIFGIFPATSFADIDTGDDMVAAGYALYGTALQFVFGSVASPLTLRQYDFKQAQFRTIIEDHKMPDKGKTYCINEGRSVDWYPHIEFFIEKHMKGRSIRWMACMVSDVHRPLFQGGSFLYPEDLKYPNGRLRLVYEAMPMAFLFEKAGGKAYASTDGKRILQKAFPSEKDVHCRCGVMLLGPTESEEFLKVRWELQHVEQQ